MNLPTNINIQCIPAAEQRYDTLGDWWFDATGTLQVRVTQDSESGGCAFLIAMHEVVEATLLAHRLGPQIAQKVVDHFDMKIWPQMVVVHPELQGTEPGDYHNAPYRGEHRFAMLVEHLLAHELGMPGYGRVE